MVVTKPYKVGVQYGLESVWGTAVARDTAFGRVTSANITMNNNPIPVVGLGAGRNATGQLFGTLDVNWTVDFELHDAEHLRLAMGELAGAGTTVSHYILNESDTVASGSFPPFTLEVSGDDTSDEVQVAEGCVCNTATISFVNGAAARVSMSGVAETMTDEATATGYTEPTTMPFIWSQITAKWGTTPTTIARVLSGSITINHNLINQRVLGNRSISQPELGLRNYTFNLTVLMSDSSYETMRTSAYGGGSIPATGVSDSFFPTTDELKFEVSEGGTGGDRNITIHLDECVIDSFSQPVTVGNNLVQVTFTGRANKGKDNDPIEYWTTT